MDKEAFVIHIGTDLSDQVLMNEIYVFVLKQLWYQILTLFKPEKQCFIIDQIKDSSVLLWIWHALLYNDRTF